MKQVAELEAALAERDATIARVRDLHLQDRADDPDWCLHCGYSWPCGTVRALDGSP